MTRSVDTAPVVPRSGARKIGMSATGPAFSTRSPMRTTSLSTVTVARSAAAGAQCGGDVRCGAAGQASSSNASAARRAGADHGEDLSQRANCEVVCSIWSAAVTTLEFIS